MRRMAAESRRRTRANNRKVEQMKKMRKNVTMIRVMEKVRAVMSNERLSSINDMNHIDSRTHNVRA